MKNAVETVKISVDSCYVLQQFLTPLPSIDFREIRGVEIAKENFAEFSKRVKNCMLNFSAKTIDTIIESMS